MTPAVRAFVEMLLCRIEALETEVAELKGRKATPQNSSVPPSSQHPHAKPKPRRKPSGRKRGGQPGHHKAERTLIPADDCDDVVVLTPKHCRRCGEELTGSDADPLRHQVWELPEIKPLVTEYQRHRLQCPCCRTSTTAALPAGVPCGGSGPRLVAFSALLMACFRQSKRRTALFVESILNIPCSPALTVKHQNLARAALSGRYAELSAALPHSEAVHADETGTKQRNEKAWLWVAVTKRFTLFAVRLTRAAEVVAELLGEEFRFFQEAKARFQQTRFDLQFFRVSFSNVMA